MNIGSIKGVEEVWMVVGWQIHSTEATRHPLNTGVFSAERITHQPGFEPTTSCVPGRHTTNCAMLEIWQMEFK